MRNNTSSLQAQRPAMNCIYAGILISFLIGLVAFLPICLPNEGRFMESGDYYPQYVPFLLEMKRMVESGNLGWSWNSFLGDSFVSAYSYYTVFNPFAWFVILFPENMILYATLAAALLKLVLSTVGAILYFRIFVKKDSYALVSGLLYTFSGFSIINTNFYFFQDVVALFPFLMYGLERLIRDNKRWLYLLALAVNAAVNFYFFVSTVIAVMLYVVFRMEFYRIRGWKQNWRALFRIAAYSVLGTGLAGIALIPSLYSILGSGKAAESFGNALYAKCFSIQDFLERLRVLLAPIESGTYHVFYNCSSWGSVAAYLPVFGCFSAFQQGIKRRDWTAKLLAFLLICYLIPGLNSIFNLFTSFTYSRWLYFPVLLMALSVSRQLEDWEENGEGIKKTALGCYSLAAAVLVLIPAGMNLMCRMGHCFGIACESPYFFGYRKMAVMVALTVGNYLLLWYLSGRKEYDYRRVLVCVILASTVNYAVFNQMNYDPEYKEYYEITLVEGLQPEETEYSYRIDHPKTSSNYCLFQNLPGVHNYNSLQNLGATKFAYNTGFIGSMSTVFVNVPEERREELDALLSVRYFIDFWQEGGVPEGFEYIYSENGVDVYENLNYIPMGFVYDHYVLQEDLKDMSPGEKSAIMLSALVIESADQHQVSRMLSPAQIPDDIMPLEAAVENRRKTACSVFTGTSEGFYAQILLEQDNVVFFSIPVDDGWHITVNGEAAEIIQSHYGLLGIVCEEGKNTIEAVYHTKGMTAGIVCSVLFALLWVLWEWICYRKR